MKGKIGRLAKYTVPLPNVEEVAQLKEMQEKQEAQLAQAQTCELARDTKFDPSLEIQYLNERISKMNYEIQELKDELLRQYRRRDY